MVGVGGPVHGPGAVSIMDKKLSESELADLCAWLDGELEPDRSSQVASLVQSDPAWSRARREMQSLNTLLETWTVPPTPAELARQIASRARRPVPWRLGRFLHWATGVAAAAALVLALMLHFGPAGPSRPGMGPVDQFTEAGRDVFPLGAGGRTQSARRADDDRGNAIVFMQMSPAQQQRLLARYERAVASAARRDAQARWLRVVLESFTPEQCDQLRRMTPAQQARAFLIRRAELIRAGKLPRR